MPSKLFTKTDKTAAPLRELTDSEARQVSGGGVRGDRAFFQYNHFHNVTTKATDTDSGPSSPSMALAQYAINGNSPG